jgi:hypothetical protein
MIRLVALAAVAAAFVVAAAGCGGSSSSSSSGATTTAASGGTDTTRSSTDTTSSSTDTTGGNGTSSSTTSSSGTASGSLTKSCLDFAGASSKIAQAFASSGKNDPEALKSYMAALADKAPASIKADFQTLADAFGKYADALKGVNLQSPSASDIQKFQKVAGSVNTPEVQKAEQNISAWVKGGCKS